ncbi:hypothetical protein ICN32_00795 [Polynucleobacter wuianus]|uniref:hypothetical protein n=1 Tax=Polynucleobacter wuianus TaxID=1743168 RepID=UPI001C0BE751|nr:hypothetical protein [Polynucleobacter wuianus]MBU3609095.1 hypothetical protein [Polynucleobacter wuianus]
MANDAQIIIGADTSELVAAMKEAQASVSSAIGNMKGSLGGLGDSFKVLQGAMVEVAAVLAGGKMFKEAVDASLEEVAAVKQLIQVMGLATDEAAKLNIQLKLAGITTEDYTSMAMKFDKQLRSNEDGLKRLGVQTRDSKGELLDQKNIMANAVSTMNDYKAGTDRNIVAQQLFGRSAQEANQLSKLTAESEAIANKLRAAGIGPTKESMEAAKQYKLAMNEAKIVVGEFSDSMGESVIPALTNMAKGVSEMVISTMPLIKGFFEAFGAVASAAGVVVKEAFIVIGEAVKGAISIIDAFASVMSGGFYSAGSAVKAFMVTWEFFKLGVLTVSEVIKTSIQSLVTLIQSLGVVIIKALNFDFAGAAAAWDKGMDDIKGVASKHLKALRDDVKDTEKALHGIVDGEAESPEKPKGTKSAPASGKESKMGEWEAKLAEAKVYYQQENDLREMSKEQEKAYWSNILATQRMTAQEKTAVTKKIAEADLEILKKAAKDRKGLTELEINESEKSALDSLKMEEELNKRKFETGQITAAQSLAVAQDFESRKFEIMQAAQQARIEAQKLDPTQDPVALQAQKDKLLEIERQHALQVESINTQMAKQSKDDWAKMFAPVTSAISQSINGMIAGTLTLKKAISNLLQSIIAEFVNAGVKMVANWAATELAKTSVSRMGATIRSALGMAETTEAVAEKTVEGTAVVGVNAAEAASGAAAAVAPTPFIGPGLAAAAFAGTMALVLGAKSLFSASGGFDVPAGANPLTQLHANEMVLPAHIANPLRDSLSGGGVGGDTHLHVHAVDSQSVERLFRDNGHLLAREMRRQARNFAPTKA